MTKPLTEYLRCLGQNRSVFINSERVASIPHISTVELADGQIVGLRRPGFRACISVGLKIPKEGRTLPKELAIPKAVRYPPDDGWSNENTTGHPV